MTETRCMEHVRFGPCIVAAASLTLLAGWCAPSSSATETVLPQQGQRAELPAAAIPEIPHALPVTSDPAASYEAQTRCDSAPKPGTVKLANLIHRTYGSDSIGISRGCGVGGTSEHKEGRALDWMTSVRSARGEANAKAFLSWLLGPDQFGVPNGNATRLGVMYIGWNDQFWRAYDVGRGWTELNTCLSAPASGDDTSCHRNHMHISLTWDGASGRTSIWDGTPLAPFCQSPRASASVITGGRAQEAIAVPPIRVLSTRDGVGLASGPGYGAGGFDEWSRLSRDGDHGDDETGRPNDETSWPDDGSGTEEPPGDVPVPPVAVPAAPPAVVPPCRLGPSGWHGDVGGVLTQVTGQGGVPASGVVAVAVTVRAIQSTAPAEISVWGPGQDAHKVVTTVRLNRDALGSAIVPVASDGTIALGTSAGGTDVTVDVTGYYLAGDQSNRTTVG
jgi:hypothetical protein